MKTLLYIPAVCLMQTFAFGQSDVVVKVNLKDSRFGDPVRNATATIEIGDKKLTKMSNHEGVFFFDVALGSTVVYTFEHFKYETDKFQRKLPSKSRKDTLEHTFDLDFMTEQYIEEMFVAAPGVPIIQYGSKKLHVEDFEILPDGNMVLLTYPKNLKKGHELLLYDGKKVLSRFAVDDQAEELIRDFRGNPHIVGKNSIHGIHVDDEGIGLSTVEKDYFMKYVAPILDTNGMKLYFSNFNKDYPAFDYFTFDRIDSTYTKILGIQDDLMMELYRSEYKWVDVRTKLWAKNKEIQTGIDAEIWVGANYFTKSIYYKELYAPLFHRNDTLFVFDYYQDYLRTFTADGEKIDSIPIYHHYDPRNTGWESNLIQDPATGQIYAIYERAGYSYIGWINTDTGEISEQIRLEDRYAHSIQVNNNHIYYIYRPYESPQKKYLYKERMPYNFGKASMLKGELVSRHP